ncbi:hypothetical protein [Pseudobacteriovorax antillogorgiicola]|uniref:Uncharacterized protein n=1 Tax=Pseudobacteriovorax antillogorgiicola TaxID=1513793 RepID=A0A1Y6CML8_9BACT|nr:hypothetical protein [Pseudobacteriovorax antillogorgiicola]TCS45446.1 hypothetical protein EDD56_12857 [Pseudobacteriovorax antillogorgiicola]SMF74599.1 hypothetical protein SAMN06296036_12857 [Pseudobacteriovorax antillogorgiicola]
MKNLISGRGLSFLCTCILMVQCGVFVGNPADETDGVEADGSIPDDSTGTSSSMTLTLSADSSATLQGASTPLILPNGLTINYGRLTVSRLRMVPSAEESEFEQGLDERLSQIEEQEDPGKATTREEKEGSIESIEAEYDELIAAAATEEEKEALREQEDEERATHEEEVASIEKELQDEKDALEDTEDSSLKLKDNDYVYDLLANTVTPSIDSFSALDGSYQRVEFELRPLRESSDPKLLNRAALVEGVIEIDSTTRRVEVEVRQLTPIKLKGTGGLQVDADDTNDMIIKFALGAWFVDVNLNTATVNTRGEIHINEKENRPLYDAILQNIRRSTKFGEDQDTDGQLDDDELVGDGDD